jgi:hypothetical protein
VGKYRLMWLLHKKKNLGGEAEVCCM